MASNAGSSVMPIEISERRSVRAAPAAVWSVLGDFGAEHRWASQLRHCERDTEAVRVGAIRTCVLAKALMGRKAVAEQLIDYDPGKTLAYQLLGGAGPFRTAEGRWTIIPERGGVLVEVSGRFQPRGALIGLVFGRLARAFAQRAARRALDDLADFVEAR